MPWPTCAPAWPPACGSLSARACPSRPIITFWSLAVSPRLRALIIPWAGLPDSTRAFRDDFGHVAVHNLRHNAVPVAEMALNLLLAAARRSVPIDRSLRAHDWTPRYQPNPAVLMEGKTALILGYGAIGRRVARMCRGLCSKSSSERQTWRGSSKRGSPAWQVFKLPNELLLHGLDGGSALAWSGLVSAGRQVQLALVAQARPDLGSDVVVSNTVSVNYGADKLLLLHSPDTTLLLQD